MSKKGRDTSRRIKEMQAAQRRAEQRRRNLTIGAVVLVVIAAVVGIGIAVQSNRDQTGANVQIPHGVVDKYGIPRGDSGAPVTVDLYEDFQCPVCKAYEGFLGDTITKNVDDGTIRVVYHPIAILDRMSSTDYSSRALETAACVVDEDDSGVFVKLHDLLFQQQPAEGSAGLSDAQLADLAAQAGANKSDVEKCQAADTFVGWVRAATDTASKAHVTGTPTMRIGGQDVAIVGLAKQDAINLLQSTIDAAAAAAGAAAPTTSGSTSTG